VDSGTCVTLNLTCRDDVDDCDDENAHLAMITSHRLLFQPVGQDRCSADAGCRLCTHIDAIKPSVNTFLLAVFNLLARRAKVHRLPSQILLISAISIQT